MALAGTLKDFGLPDIIQLIGLQRKTGTLHLKSGSEAVKVIFEGGNIVAAANSVVREADRLGNALVNQGSITEDQLKQALSAQKQTMQRLGHVLISEQIVSEEVLRQAVESQLFQVVFRLFRWREGEYNFETQAVVDYEKNAAISLGADFVLMEGIRMVDEWPIIERRIPSMASVFKKVVDPNQIQAKKGGGDGEVDGLLSGLDASEGGRLSLSGDELLVFNAVDGTKSCEQIVAVTPLHDFAVCRTLLDLMDRDVVALTDVKGSTSRKKRRGDSGGAAGVAFMGVAVLAALFGVYRNLTTPFGVFGLAPLVQGAVHTAIETRLLERMETVDARVLGFRLAYGRLPESLDELVSEGLATRASIDGVRLVVSAKGYRLEMAGPAGAVHIDRDLLASESSAPSASPSDAGPPPPAVPSS